MRRTSITGSLAAGALGLALLLTGCGGGAEPRWAAATAGASAAADAPSGDPAASAAGSAGASPVASASTAGCGPWGCDQQRRLEAAANLIKTKPGYLGMIVRDRRTGATWRAGTPEHVMWTSSTIKLAMATGLLERARAGEITLDATARQQIAAMLSVSDNDAADALWKRYGKDTMVSRFQQVYGMTGLTFVSGSPRYWGFMKASAEDLQRLMSYVLDKLNPADRDYLVGAMRRVGQIQQWGVWAAGPAQQPGTKDGWSLESDPGGKHWCTSTVGFAGPDARYVVAVMYHLPPGNGTIDAGVHAVSDAVATVFGAPTPAPVTVPDPSTGL
ncbi:serine hydrolase [Planosporangium sp. 12N6]|uniref:serine hydrolase n=1 Tax=Planosporangium spinosum TaxID=3402278 RepID=UPI003CEA82D2